VHSKKESNRLNGCSIEAKVCWKSDCSGVTQLQFLLLSEFARSPPCSRGEFAFMLCVAAASAFPSANVELVNAARCYALEQSAACVFHLVRSAEIVVRCLITRLQIPLPTKDGDRNWAGTLKEIRSKLDAQKANLPPDDRLFFDNKRRQEDEFLVHEQLEVCSLKTSRSRAKVARACVVV
jgi:hypothetical protein